MYIPWLSESIFEDSSLFINLKELIFLSLVSILLGKEHSTGIPRMSPESPVVIGGQVILEQGACVSYL